MSRLRLFILFLAVAGVGLFVSQEARADVYASWVRITQDFSTAPFDGSFNDGTGAGIRFFLNDNADSVVVEVYPAGGGSVIRRLVKKSLLQGDNLITWNGADNGGAAATAGSYKFDITAYSAGYASYTVYHNSTPAIFTRGVGSVNNPALKRFGFIYAVSGGGYATGLVRHTSYGTAWGDSMGTAKLTTTGEALGGSNRRYATTFDDEGFGYVIGRDERDIFRFHLDSLVVSRYDSSNYGTIIQGLDVHGTGGSKYIYVTGDAAVFGIPAGTQSFNTAALDSLVAIGPYTGKGLVFWDAEKGEDNSLYVIFRADSAIDALPAGARGVAKFDLNTGTNPRTMANAVWTSVLADGDPVTLSLWNGPTSAASDDILYMSHDNGGAKTEKSGVYAFTNLGTATPTRTLAWADPDDNTTSFRGSVVVDAVGNVIYFENSNEHVTLISPPTGANSYKYTALDSLTITTTGTTAPLVTISEARIDANGDRQPDRSDTVRVVGVVTSTNLQTTNFGYTIQDDNGGITIFRSGLTGAPALVPGHRVMVRGGIGYFRGTTQISPANLATDITILDSNVAITPVDLTIGQYRADPEKYESRRIRLAVVHPLDFTSAAWPATGSSANLNVWNGKDTTILRIDSDTEVDGSTYPTFPVKLTGVGSQFTTSSGVHNDGYQITPIYNADFVAINTPPLANFALSAPANNSTFVLDDTSQTLTFSWKKAVDFNNDALIYQWVPVGFTPVLTGNSGADTMYVLKGSTMLTTYLGANDSLVLRWTAIAKDPTNAPVTNPDTMTVTLKKGAVVSVEGVEGIPTDYTLYQNYPNPFNPSTTIRVALPMQSVVSLTVYNLLGQEIVTLVNNSERPAGYLNVDWNGRNRFGESVASGVYIYRVVAKSADGSRDFVTSKKLMLLK